MKVVKRVIVGVLVAALAAGGIYTGLMHVKESKVTEVPVTSVSNLQTDLPEFGHFHQGRMSFSPARTNSK